MPALDLVIAVDTMPTRLSGPLACPCGRYWMPRPIDA